MKNSNDDILDKDGTSVFYVAIGTVCPKVPVNSNVVDFSAISGPILKPFDLHVATLGRFDMMYNIP